MLIKKFNTMKTYKYILVIITIMSIISCEKSYLDVSPQATIEESMLATPKNADALVTAAYAMLTNASLIGFAQWKYGGVRSEEAYMGSESSGGPDSPLEVFNTMTSDFNGGNETWIEFYICVSRCNKALAVLGKITDDEMPSRKIRMAETRFLRGHYYFMLKTLFRYPPWVDETMTNDDIKKKSNRELTDIQLWDLIAADFKYAYDNLPETQSQIGRANKYAAAAYLAKTRLYQAYEQDDQNNVISVNQSNMQEVVAMCDVVINSGKYALFDNFGKNFTYGYDNGVESIFAKQYSINDGTVTGKVDLEHLLNYNMAPGYGCCWFNVPSQNLVNAFKTDANGLPLFDTYNNVDISIPSDFITNTVDPRLDHTVGIPTHPFKYDLTFVYDYSWARTPAIYGYYSSMKECQLPSSPSFKRVGPFFGSSKNIDILRYDDVLLMKAEALIELGQQDDALPLINQIRTRAANTDWLKFGDGTTTFSNYNISSYQDGVNIDWTQANARKALRFERKLEFAMESPRFLDLVRWGIAAETLNAFFEVEKTKHPYLSAAHFRKNQDEYLPIPLTQITLSEGLYQQNAGTW
jgi:starch-binding outer membrane protein, SusD/RagB family